MKRLQLVLLVAAGAVGGALVRTPGELALQYGIALLTGAGALLFCYRFARDNYLAYAVVLHLSNLAFHQERRVKIE